ncbi:hypothetical protein SCHPADRAFT_897709 [Schizopora paradoxa]|uniref:C3H1-type domain-containing protein n=1 Tax=Schizopora paradoxa TaxID=27342 RepID=A0A0H2S835_9AGAM|nr:hypothetical protein SCHPADRAFT_897709 [Schizopora paradoxa]
MSIPQANSSNSGNRYQRRNPKLYSDAWNIGKERTTIALERYHYLCAAIQGKYRFLYDIPPKYSRGQFFSRQGFDFSPYTKHELKPIRGVKFHPREDGTIHPVDLGIYHEYFANSWRNSEGGILYSVNDHREFFNCILNYHSPAKTSGDEEWDQFFKRLKESGFQMGLVPCMYFAQAPGCLDSDCPFLHDEEMSRGHRSRILAARRKTLLEPTPKQRFHHIQRTYNQGTYSSRDSSALALMKSLSLNGFNHGDDTEDEETKIKVPRVRHFCANTECMKPWLRKHKGDPPLRKCAKCLWTFYCSVHDCIPASPILYVEDSTP